MKTLLFVLMESGRATDELYSDLNQHGHNGTIVATQGIKHILNNAAFDKPAVLSLTQLAEGTHGSGANSMMLFVVEEQESEEIRAMVRLHSENFKRIHGAMFEIPLEKYEGSF